MTLRTSWIFRFVLCHKKYSQSEYRKTIVYSTVILHPTFPSCVALIMLDTVFLTAWHGIVMQHSLMICHEISHLSLLFPCYTLSHKGSCLYRGNIPRYITQKWCITSVYLWSNIITLRYYEVLFTTGVWRLTAFLTVTHVLVKSINASIDAHANSRGFIYGVQTHGLWVGNLDSFHCWSALCNSHVTLQRALGLSKVIVLCNNRHIQCDGNDRLKKLE